MSTSNLHFGNYVTRLNIQNAPRFKIFTLAVPKLVNWFLTLEVDLLSVFRKIRQLFAPKGPDVFLDLPPSYNLPRLFFSSYFF